MNTTSADNIAETEGDSLGEKLAIIREKKGFTTEYVAGKLNLRVRMIELIEADAYQELPQPVFVKGYLRAYAKLLDLAPEPYLNLFNTAFFPEKKIEKMLWQTKRDTNKGEQVIRWATAGVVIAAIMAVSFWWHKNKEVQPQTSLIAEKHEPLVTKVASNANDSVSTMQSLFSTEENTGDSK